MHMYIMSTELLIIDTIADYTVLVNSLLRAFPLLAPKIAIRKLQFPPRLVGFSMSQMFLSPAAARPCAAKGEKARR